MFSQVHEGLDEVVAGGNHLTGDAGQRTESGVSAKRKPGGSDPVEFGNQFGQGAASEGLAAHFPLDKTGLDGLIPFPLPVKSGNVHHNTGFDGIAGPEADDVLPDELFISAGILGKEGNGVAVAGAGPAGQEAGRRVFMAPGRGGSSVFLAIGLCDSRSGPSFFDRDRTHILRVKHTRARNRQSAGVKRG